MVVQTEDFVSPVKWHLGHTTWFLNNLFLFHIKKIIDFLISHLILILIITWREILILDAKEGF